MDVCFASTGGRCIYPRIPRLLVCWRYRRRKVKGANSAVPVPVPALRTTGLDLRKWLHEPRARTLAGLSGHQAVTPIKRALELLAAASERVQAGCLGHRRHLSLSPSFLPPLSVPFELSPSTCSARTAYVHSYTRAAQLLLCINAARPLSIGSTAAPAAARPCR